MRHDRTVFTCCYRCDLLLALASPALADDPKPDFAITTKSIEATVVLDAAIKADPALAANCLAEGKKWAEKQRPRPTRRARRCPMRSGNGGWTVERKYEQRSVVADRYVSVVRNDYTNTGGAHPNLDLDTILWDRTAAKRISIRPFFKETADGGPTLKFLASSIIDAVKIAKKARHDGEDTDTDWIKTHPADAAETRRGDADALDRGRQEFGADLPLRGQRAWRPCRRRLCRLRAMGAAETVSDAGRRGDLRRRPPRRRR